MAVISFATFSMLIGVFHTVLTVPLPKDTRGILPDVSEVYHDPDELAMVLEANRQRFKRSALALDDNDKNLSLEKRTASELETDAANSKIRSRANRAHSRKNSKPLTRKSRRTAIKKLRGRNRGHDRDPSDANKSNLPLKLTSELQPTRGSGLVEGDGGDSATIGISSATAEPDENDSVESAVDEEIVKTAAQADEDTKNKSSRTNVSTNEEVRKESDKSNQGTTAEEDEKKKLKKKEGKEEGNNSDKPMEEKSTAKTGGKAASSTEKEKDGNGGTTLNKVEKKSKAGDRENEVTTPTTASYEKGAAAFKKEGEHVGVDKEGNSMGDHDEASDTTKPSERHEAEENGLPTEEKKEGHTSQSVKTPAPTKEDGNEAKPGVNREKEKETKTTEDKKLRKAGNRKKQKGRQGDGNRKKQKGRQGNSNRRKHKGRQGDGNRKKQKGRQGDGNRKKQKGRQGDGNRKKHKG
uniref:Prepropeptide n=1 Tax=Tripedalia cystophora TaxID=6141 RepID=A0A482A321_TRICY|nr:prepropeptide [Tripedalia cystophora]